METEQWSDFVEYITNKKSYELARAVCDVLKVLKLHEPYFESFQNISRAYKSQNGNVCIEFPILIIIIINNNNNTTLFKMATSVSTWSQHAMHMDEVI